MSKIYIYDDRNARYIMGAPKSTNPTRAAVTKIGYLEYGDVYQILDKKAGIYLIFNMTKQKVGLVRNTTRTSSREL